MALGKTIEQLRKQRGLTRQALAEHMEVHQSMVSRWETDQSLPRAKTLERLAEFFGVSKDQLLAGDYGGLANALNEAEDPELVLMLGQLNRLTSTERLPLKTVLGAMLDRAQVADVVGNRDSRRLAG